MYIDEYGHLRFEPPRYPIPVGKWHQAAMADMELERGNILFSYKSKERIKEMNLDTEYVIRNGDRFGLGKVKAVTTVPGCIPVLDLDIKDISHLPSTSPFSVSEQLNVVVNNDVDNIIVTVINNFLKDECGYTIPKKRLISAIAKAGVRLPIINNGRGKKQCARCFSDLDANGNFCSKCGQRFTQLKEDDYVY